MFSIWLASKCFWIIKLMQIQGCFYHFVSKVQLPWQQHLQTWTDICRALGTKGPQTRVLYIEVKVIDYLDFTVIGIYKMFPIFNLDTCAHLTTWRTRFDLEFSDSSESATSRGWPGRGSAPPRPSSHLCPVVWGTGQKECKFLSPQASSVTICSCSAKQLPLDHFRRRACADPGNRFGAIWAGRFGVPKPQSGGQAQSENSSLALHVPCPRRWEEDQSKAKIIYKF